MSADALRVALDWWESHRQHALKELRLADDTVMRLKAELGMFEDHSASAEILDLEQLFRDKARRADHRQPPRPVFGGWVRWLTVRSVWWPWR